MAEKERELKEVVQKLSACLASRLGLKEDSSSGLNSELVAALGKKLGIKGEVSVMRIVNRMGDFGLDLAHLEVDKLENKVVLHEYFFLDLALLLIDSIDQVKSARAAGVVSSLLEGSVRETSLGGSSSGAEEVSKILEEARTKYGRITTSFKSGLDAVDISSIPAPQTKKKQPSEIYASKSKPFPPQYIPRERDESELGNSGSTDNDGKDTTDFKDVPIGTLKTKAQPRPKRRKLSREAAMKIRQAKENIKEDVDNNEEEEEDHEINVNIPISDTTDVRIKVKPLDNRELKSQRIHVRVNQKRTPVSKSKSRSRHIVYGSKNIVSHHLRKARPPLFSKKPATPKLDKKQVLERVVSEVKKKRAREEESAERNIGTAENASKPKQFDFQLEAQKLLREKRTKNAQFKKLMQKL